MSPPLLHLATPLSLHLASGELLAWHHQGAATLRLVSGAAWVTRANDLEDHFLAAGQALPLQPGEQLLIGAESALLLRVEPLARPVAPGLARLARALGRLARALVRGPAGARGPAATVAG